MNFKEKLQILRTEHKLSQEDLANKLNISRQSVTKWENGQSFPDIHNLILLSEIFNVSIDRFVKERDGCMVNLIDSPPHSKDSIPLFLVRAKNNCYINGENMVPSTRFHSHDYQYKENDFLYTDSYFGTEKFGGQEIVFINEKPVYLMNYYGNVLDENFSTKFLKEALSLVTIREPYRGPEFYQKDNYSYHCKINGSFSQYHGEEQIFFYEKKVYCCHFHGGGLG